MTTPTISTTINEIPIGKAPASETIGPQQLGSGAPSMAKTIHNTDAQSTNFNLVENLGMKMLSSSLSSYGDYQSSILVKCRNDDLFNYIPDSILAEIFKRLPVKSLLRCTCVKKSWYYFIRTPLFINTHLNYNPKPNYLLFESNYTCELLLRYDNQHCQEFGKLELPSVIPLSTKWYATSSSLICFSTIYNDWHLTNYTGHIVLFNPLIRKHKTLPSLVSPAYKTHCVYLAFGHVPLINDYHVVKIVNYSDENKIRLFSIYVYSLRTNSWTTKTVQDDILTRVCNPFESILVNGVAFWRTQSKNGAESLLCFDTINGIMRNIPLPEEYSCDPSLQQFGQSVVYFTDDPEIADISMWILRGDPMKDFFWEKKFTINLDEDIMTEVLGIRNNGELILSKIYECDLVSYNCEDDEVKDFVGSWNRWSTIGMDRKDMGDSLFEQSPFIVRPFVEGLVLLDAD